MPSGALPKAKKPVTPTASPPRPAVSALHYCAAAIWRWLIPVVERAAELTRSGDFAFLSAWITGMLGNAYVLAGKLDEARFLLEEGVARMSAMQVRNGEASMITVLGEACLMSGRHAEAVGHAERALKIARGRGERGGEAWALRLTGDIAAAGADWLRRSPPFARRSKLPTNAACGRCWRIAISASAGCTGMPGDRRAHASRHGAAPLPRYGHAPLAAAGRGRRRGVFSSSNHGLKQLFERASRPLARVSLPARGAICPLPQPTAPEPAWSPRQRTSAAPRARRSSACRRLRPAA